MGINTNQDAIERYDQMPISPAPVLLPQGTATEWHPNGFGQKIDLLCIN